MISLCSKCRYDAILFYVVLGYHMNWTCQHCALTVETFIKKASVTGKQGAFRSHLKTWSRTYWKHDLLLLPTSQLPDQHWNEIDWLAADRQKSGKRFNTTISTVFSTETTNTAPTSQPSGMLRRAVRYTTTQQSPQCSARNPPTPLPPPSPPECWEEQCATLQHNNLHSVQHGTHQHRSQLPALRNVEKSSALHYNTTIYNTTISTAFGTETTNTAPTSQPSGMLRRAVRYITTQQSPQCSARNPPTPLPPPSPPECWEEQCATLQHNNLHSVQHGTHQHRSQLPALRNVEKSSALHYNTTIYNTTISTAFGTETTNTAPTSQPSGMLRRAVRYTTTQQSTTQQSPQRSARKPPTPLPPPSPPECWEEQCATLQHNNLHSVRHFNHQHRSQLPALRNVEKSSALHHKMMAVKEVRERDQENCTMSCVEIHHVPRVASVSFKCILQQQGQFSLVRKQE